VTPTEIVPPVVEQTTPPTEGEALKSLIEGEAKPEVEVAPFVPLTAEDITLPEGFTPEPELMTEFLSVVNDQELSAKDRAQGLLDLQSKLMTKASEASSAAWDAMQDEWQAAVKADPTIGGERFTASIAQVNKLVAEYGNNEVVDAFALTGAGNNPAIVKFLHTLAGKLTEGGYTQGQPTNAPANAAQLLYPSMKG